ncbi:MAG: N-succinylarginine dihydrolase [Proteobacteria bacterium]|nr:MAG: N-succinylarginine dihydrolase [Pseudomonadota bacterium]
MTSVEVNFDGLPGPTHNFSGLASGNLASARSARARSWPRKAALQSIAKMRVMLDLGLAQGILPPHPRPDIGFLRRIGFTGTDDEVIARTRAEAPGMLIAASSASFMWTANATTVSAARDTADGRVHFTTANLSSQLHRAIEPEFTDRLLRMLFSDDEIFAHHTPLPCALGDEGAANHTRLASTYDSPGVSLFVYGRSLVAPEPRQSRMAARQCLEASQSVARQHGLDAGRVIFARQHPAAIDSGVFHNDVIAVGNRDLLLAHEFAFENQERVIRHLSDLSAGGFRVVIVPNDSISLERAVDTYLFNAQLVSPPDRPGDQILVAPIECRDDVVVRRYLESLQDAGVLNDIVYMDVRESMRNGGGPACLRLRVVMEYRHLERLPGQIVATHDVLDRLEACIESVYPEHIDPEDLAAEGLVASSRRAMEEIYRTLELPLPD